MFNALDHTQPMGSLDPFSQVSQAMSLEARAAAGARVRILRTARRSVTSSGLRLLTAGLFVAPVAVAGVVAPIAAR